jgi:2-polyprenyl-6-methoxyphenol hydroxylase-like FAD-dependent oxidoreductase
VLGIEAGDHGGIGVGEERRQALDFVGFADFASSPAQGIERPENATIRFVGPGDGPTATPPGLAQCVKTPVVSDPGVGVRLKHAFIGMGDVGQFRPGKRRRGVGRDDDGDLVPCGSIERLKHLRFRGKKGLGLVDQVIAGHTRSYRDAVRSPPAGVAAVRTGGVSAVGAIRTWTQPEQQEEDGTSGRTEMPQDVFHTQCCIAGGGPAGLMLGLLLARAGVDVIVLEKHSDFFRDFRGDTIHPSTLDLIDQLGLREQFDRIPQSKVVTLDLVINGNRFTPVNFSHLHGRNRHVSLMPQWDFLTLLAEEGGRYPNFRLLLAAEVTGLLHAPGDPEKRVVGVTGRKGSHEFRVSAPLTVAADGRESIVRAAAGMAPRKYGVPIDVLWSRLSQPEELPPDTLGYLNRESMVVTIPRTDYYQTGMLIRKGSYPAVQAAGIEEFRARLVRAAPFLAAVVGAVENWDQVKLLTVQVNRLDRWWRPGLICIGDAAHAMSPAFGVGVNYAIQDAVAAARVLAAPLRRGTLSARVVKRIQRRRQLPVRLMQPIQLTLHRVIARPGGGGFVPSRMPWWQRAVAYLMLPVLRRVMARLVGRGFRPERLTGELLQERR